MRTRNLVSLVFLAWFGACAGTQPAASASASAEVWEPDPSGRDQPGWEIAVQSAHTAKVNQVVFSPDGSLLASASSDATVKLYNTRSRRLLHTFVGQHGEAECTAFSPNGRLLAVGSSKGPITIWDLRTLKAVKALDRQDGKVVTHLAFSPDGALLLAGGWQSIAVWSMKSGKMQGTIKGYAGGLKGVAFTPDGRTMVSLSSVFRDGARGEVIVADGRSFSPRRVLSVIGQALAVHPKGTMFALAHGNSSVSIWDPNTVAMIASYQSDCASLAFNRSGDALICGGARGQIGIYDIARRTVVTMGESSGWANHVAASPDGTLVVGSKGREITMWNPATARFIGMLSGSTRTITSIVLSDDGSTIYAGMNDGTVRLLSLRDGKIIAVLGAPREKAIRSMAVTHNENYLVTADEGKQGALWDLGTRALITQAQAESVALSPDDRTIGFAEGRSVTLWDVAARRETKKLVGDFRYIGAIRWVSFSGDSRYVACEMADGLQLWDVVGDKDHGNILKGHFGRTAQFKIGDFEVSVGDWANTVRFSPAQNIIASGASDGFVTLWSVPEGRIIRRMGKHQGWIEALAFSSDGKLLASGGQDARVKVWEVDSGRLLHDLAGHAGSINSLSFSRQGGVLASASGDDRAVLWDTQSGKQIGALVMAGDQDFVMYTPEGYYLATKGSAQSLAFKKGLAAYSFAQMDLRLNRPDLVLSRFGKAPDSLVTAYRSAYLKRLKKMGFTEEMLGSEMEMPQVRLDLAAVPMTSQDATVKFRMTASDPSTTLDRINVYVNDVPVFGAAGIDVRGRNSRSLELPVSVALGEGKNKVEVSALNARGTESLRESFEITRVGARAKPRLLVVAIGVSRYQKKDYNLVYASKDARDLIALLKQSKDAYAEVLTLPILDEAATKENILRARSFLMQSGVDDRVILFAAGHGLLDEKLDYYFGTTDVDAHDPSARGLPYGELESLLDGIPARQKLLLVDACHSGEVDKDGVTKATVSAAPATRVGDGTVVSRGLQLKAAKHMVGVQNSFELMQEIFTDLRRGSGAAVISSTAGTQLAFESATWKNGVFTYAILDGLGKKSADANGDGAVTVSELRRFVAGKVRDMTNGKQIPVTRRENLEFDWRVY